MIEGAHTDPRYSCYRHALETNPLCPPAVRLGIGLCHARLGNSALARKAFERVLQLVCDDRVLFGVSCVGLWL